MAVRILLRAAGGLDGLSCVLIFLSMLVRRQIVGQTDDGGHEKQDDKGPQGQGNGDIAPAAADNFLICQFAHFHRLCPQTGNCLESKNFFGNDAAEYKKQIEYRKPEKLPWRLSKQLV